MSESTLHVRLVKALVSWISDSLLKGDHGYILVDLPDSSPQKKPPKINNFIPDVCVPHAPDGRYIIGEAKIAENIDNRHTKEQIRAFLRKCAKSGKSMFILAVPWDIVRLAKFIVEDLQNQIDAKKVEVIILEKLPIG